MSGKAQRFKKTTMAFRWDGTFDGQVRLAEWLRGWTKHEPATVGENVEIDGQTVEPGDYVICNMVSYPHVIGREAFERTYQVDDDPAVPTAEPSDGRWRKRPVVIEAHRWYRNGDHPADHVGDLEYMEAEESVVIGPAERRERDWEGAVVRRFRLPGSDGKPCPECGVDLHGHGWIDTLEGGHRVCPGDWIITGVAGERYPCKDSIFRATYEPAGCLDGDTVGLPTAEQPCGPMCQDHGQQGLDIGCAVQAMRHGHRVQRQGWNGKGMFVFLRPSQPSAPDQATGEPTWPEDACMVLATAQKTLQAGWNASTPDLLALDWQIVK